MFFWNSLAFSMIQQMLAIWSLVPLSFLNPAWTSGSSRTVHIPLKPGLENFEHYFASIWDECNCAAVWAFFGFAFLWYWKWKLSFSSPVATAEFSQFTGILSEALSQHHLSGFEICLIESLKGGCSVSSYGIEFSNTLAYWLYSCSILYL